MNRLEYAFYQMGADILESDDGSLPDQDYCDAAMRDWYRFQNAVLKDDDSPVYNELPVAITEIVELGE